MSSRSTKVISLSLAQGIMTIMSIVSGMIFTRYLSVHDYATYLQTFLAYDFCVPFLTFGLPSALYYFLPGERNNQKGLVIDNLTLLIFSGLIFSIFLLIGGTDIISKRFNNDSLHETLRWMILYPLYTLPIVIAPVLIIKDKVKENAYYNVITGTILTLSIIIAAYLSKTYAAPTLVRIFLPLVYFPISLCLTFKYVDGYYRLPSFKSMLQILKFAIPLGLASVFGTMTVQFANLIVSIFCSPEEYALFATGAKEVPIVGIINSSISVVIMAEMSSNCKLGNKELALQNFKDAANYSASFMFPIFIYLLIFCQDFITVLYTESYLDSTLPFIICLFLLPFRIVYWGSAYISLGYPKMILNRSVIELCLTTIICFFMVKFLGYRWAALSLVVVTYFFSLPYNLYSLGKLFNVSPSKILSFYELSKILIISIIVGLISLPVLLFNIPSIYKLLISLLIFATLYLILGYRYIPTIKSFIIRYIQR